MTQLRELTIMDCFYSSSYDYIQGGGEDMPARFDGKDDDAFTGKNMASGTSISNLKNLKWLTIAIVDANLGDSTLMHILHINSLHSLNINCNQVRNI